MAAAVVNDSFLDFRAEGIVRIPEHLRRDSYRILWGAGDLWILPDRFYELYDVFVCFGETGGAAQLTGGVRIPDPPAEGLISRMIPNDSNEILIENRIRALRFGKIIVYINSRERNQCEAFGEIFRNSVSLFEELGVHNQIEGLNLIHSNMLQNISQIGGIIKLSRFDYNCDGDINRPEFDDAVGNDPCARYDINPGMEEERRLQLIEIIRRSGPLFQINVDLERLSFNEIVFVAGHVQNRDLRNLYERKCNFIVNIGRRLYSENNVLQLIIRKHRDVGENNHNERRRRNAWTRRRHLFAQFLRQPRRRQTRCRRRRS